MSDNANVKTQSFQPDYKATCCPVSHVRISVLIRTMFGNVFRRNDENLHRSGDVFTSRKL